MRESETPFFIVNVDGIVRRGERYLLTVRSEQEAHAPGTLSFPGGKIEFSDAMKDTLEHTVKREILEETGVKVENPVYLESNWFKTNDGVPVLDIVFLCTYIAGEAKAVDSAELADVLWLTASAVMAHPKTPVWTRESIERAELIMGSAR